MYGGHVYVQYIVYANVTESLSRVFIFLRASCTYMMNMIVQPGKVADQKLVPFQRRSHGVTTRACYWAGTRCPNFVLVRELESRDARNRNNLHGRYHEHAKQSPTYQQVGVRQHCLPVAWYVSDWNAKDENRSSQTSDQ